MNAYNKGTLEKQDIQVQRAMLEVDLDPKMASALRSHEKIKDDTKIDATDPEVGCLETLREIFLEKNPVWLRRHWYFCCTQQPNETVQQWWNRKLDKGRQCELDKITVKDIQMLELMRGIHSQPLRREFLRQRDPTLEKLLQIANDWQRSSDVTKNMESSVDAKKTTEQLQKGKEERLESEV